MRRGGFEARLRLSDAAQAAGQSGAGPQPAHLGTAQPLRERAEPAEREGLDRWGIRGRRGLQKARRERILVVFHGFSRFFQGFFQGFHVFFKDLQGFFKGLSCVIMVTQAFQRFFNDFHRLRLGSLARGVWRRLQDASARVSDALLKLRFRVPRQFATTNSKLKAFKTGKNSAKS